MRLAAGPAGGDIALPQAPSRYKGDGTEGMGSKGFGIVRGRKGSERKDVKGEGRMGRKWEGW